jgi:dCMP deaminase
MRPTRDEMLMQIAEVVSQRSTCSRAAVGVVVARQGRVLITGYNGAPAGMPHCFHYEGENEPCEVSVHAEANAVAWAARWGISLEGAELFTTVSSCLNCAKLLINAGITRVISKQQYREAAGLELLRSAGIALR